LAVINWEFGTLARRKLNISIKIAKKAVKNVLQVMARQN